MDISTLNRTVFRVVAPAFAIALTAAPTLADRRVSDSAKARQTLSQQAGEQGFGQPQTDGKIEETILDTDPAYRAWVSKQPAVRNFRLDLDRTQRGRSIGGNPITEPGHFENVVLQLDQGGGANCSAVAVSRNVVVTAAHCLCKDVTKGKLVVGTAAGAADATPIPLTNAKTWKPDDVECTAGGGVSHPTVRGRDFAVIVTDKNLPKRVRTALNKMTIASGRRLTNMTTRDEIYIVGYGRRAAANPASAGVKNFLVSPVVSPRCDRPLDARYDCVKDKDMVAIDTSQLSGDPVGPCFSDSGGAAFLIEKRSAGRVRLHLAGVISRLITTTARCGDGGIYGLMTPAWTARLEKEALALGGHWFAR